jgi:hypothetical protein
MSISEFAERPRLHSQFVLSKSDVPPSYRAFEIDSWRVGYGDGFALTRILDSRREPIGVFLGAVTDFASKSFKPASITVPWTQGWDRKALEDALYQRAGSWVAIIVTDGLKSVYLDACGSVPLVFFQDKFLAASSACALLDDKEYFNDLYEEAKSETWSKLDRFHTAGLTAHRSLNRLLPNHRLDLESWTVQRIWPHAPFPSLGIDEVISGIVEDARGSIDIAMKGGNALMPLTAGNETRALLALARGRENRLTFFTGDFPGAVIDLGAAQRLAGKFGLKHVVTSVRRRTKADIEDWRLRTGHCIGGAIGHFRMQRDAIAQAQVEFSGAAGEVGRGFLWSANDVASDSLTSDVLLARLKLPQIDRFVAATDKWLESVKHFDAFTVMDLAYIELKMACWAGPQATGTETSATQIWPLSSRRCFSAMMSAPPQVRLEQSLFLRIVQREWPELLEIPINKGTPWENMRRFIYRASSPGRVWNKIRKNLAKIKPAKETA